MVTNARQVKVTGRKEEQKLYRHHTMFPGGLKERKYKDVQASKPDEVSSVMPMLEVNTYWPIRRLFAKQYRACYRRIGYETDD